MLNIRIAKTSEIAWINECYENVGFIPSNFDKEIIAIAEYENQKAGIGRLVHIDGHNLELGGMYVFETFRGKGIARQIVDFLLGKVLPSQKVYCIPFQHLEHFYKAFGFVTCHGKIPQELLKKYNWCQTQYTQPTSLLVLQQ